VNERQHTLARDILEPGLQEGASVPAVHDTVHHHDRDDWDDNDRHGNYRHDRHIRHNDVEDGSEGGSVHRAQDGL
jgi:hypothetical protein